MNSIFKYTLAFAATAMLVTACSSDEPGSNEPVFTGESAYMNVQLRAAEDLSRAGEGTDDGNPSTDDLEYGKENENSINSAKFFFFNSDGIYYGQSTIWKDSIEGSTGTEPSIEFNGNAVVILDNLKEGGVLPEYVITVLNGGAQYTDAYMSGKTIKEFSKDITNWGADKENGFVMATTSYYDGTAEHDKYPYATKLTNDNFSATKEAAIANGKPVEIYVERLAARVKLSTPTGQEFFPVDVTVMGDVNGEVTEPDADHPTAGTQLYVKIDGWYISGVQEQTYLSKQFGDWTSATSLNDVNGWKWNVPTFHRSFWGQSVGYGKQTEGGLRFFTFDNPNNKTVGQVAYCNENTSTKANLSTGTPAHPNQRLVTSVLVKATVVDKDKKALNLVEHNGMYFTYERFIAYILDIVNSQNKLNYYTRTGAGTEGDPYKYHQIAQEDGKEIFRLGGANEHVYVEKGKDFPTAQLYAYNNTTMDYDAVTETTLNADLKAANAGESTHAFQGGRMYYNIPIEHLNTRTWDEKHNLATWYEGSFGVVRNHAYTVNVTSVKKLGTGVFKPNEGEIKPNENQKDPRWYLGATIKVVSWKVVTSDVPL